jgi:hypothetical protein
MSQEKRGYTSCTPHLRSKLEAAALPSKRPALRPPAPRLLPNGHRKVMENQLRTTRCRVPDLPPTGYVFVTQGTSRFGRWSTRTFLTSRADPSIRMTRRAKDAVRRQVNAADAHVLHARLVTVGQPDNLAAKTLEGRRDPQATRDCEPDTSGSTFQSDRLGSQGNRHVNAAMDLIEVEHDPPNDSHPVDRQICSR